MFELDLPDTPGFSDEVYQDLMNKRIVDINNVLLSKDKVDSHLMSIALFPEKMEDIENQMFICDN